MEPIVIRVPAVPVAQPRARAVSFAGRARMYEAAKGHPIHEFKATCRMAAQEVYTEAPIAHGIPLSVELLFVMPRPKGLPKRVGYGRLPHTKRPDFDNLEKGAIDSLSEIIWSDDAQLCSVRTEKVIAAADEQPHVVITVTRLEPTP